MTWLEKLIIVALIFSCGFIIGQWYRIQQVEPAWKTQMAEMRQDQQELAGIYIDFETRLRKLEGRAGIKW